MKTGNYLQALILVLAGGACAFAHGQGAQSVYDPMSRVSETQVAAADERLLERVALPKARAEWKGNESCGEDFRVVDVARGSFTRRGAEQKAFVYEFCQTGNGWANNGLVIVEGGRVLAHFVEEGGWNIGLRRLPDINRNGLDELVVETSGGMHQGKVGGSVTLLEVTPSAVRELGYTLAFTNECDSETNDDQCDRSYQITATPAARPVFYKQTLVNLGDEEKPRWRKRGRPQKVALTRSRSKYRLVK